MTTVRCENGGLENYSVYEAHIELAATSTFSQVNKETAGCSTEVAVSTMLLPVYACLGISSKI